MSEYINKGLRRLQASQLHALSLSVKTVQTREGSFHSKYIKAFILEALACTVLAILVIAC